MTDVSRPALAALYDAPHCERERELIYLVHIHNIYISIVTMINVKKT